MGCASDRCGDTFWGSRRKGEKHGYRELRAVLEHGCGKVIECKVASTGGEVISQESEGTSKEPGRRGEDEKGMKFLSPRKKKLMCQGKE